MVDIVLEKRGKEKMTSGKVRRRLRLLVGERTVRRYNMVRERRGKQKSILVLISTPFSPSCPSRYFKRII